MYKVFIVGSNCHYSGSAIIGAESREDAMVIIAEYKASDPDNQSDSFGWSDCLEELDGVTSENRGILHNEIFYRG
jgi:hypothetical protein